MSITTKDIQKIAHLARLSMTPADIEKFTPEIEKILGLVEQINNVVTDSVEPMAHPLHTTQRLREDIVTEQVDRALFQKIAPLTEAGLYLVPKVVE